jgi:capsular exopolysaccharide synthesis family protein
MKDEFKDTFEEKIDFKRLFSVLQRWAWLFVLLMLVGAASAYGFSRRQTPVYEATTNILVSRSSQQQVADISQSLNITQLVETYSKMLSMQEFLDIVSERQKYEVQPGNISVKALPNTQVIELRVQDENPVRAAQIADTMVSVLRERNESLQAGRYGESEQGLTIQVKNAESKFVDAQAKLDEAKKDELTKQIAQAQADIDSTGATINTLTLELERLDDMSWEEAHFLLFSARRNLVSLQNSLDQYSAEQSQRNQLLESDRAKKDENYANIIKDQIDQYGKKIESLKTSIEDQQKEITFLTPLDGEKEFDDTVLKKKNELATQKSLLKSYQDLYSSLLSSEEVKRTTNEMQNLQNDIDLYQKVYVNLLSQLEDVKKEKLQNTPNVEQVSLAIVAPEPVKPRTLLNTILGGLAGLILATAFVILRETADDTIKSSEEVKGILGVQVLGYILSVKDEADGKGVYVARFPRSPIAEAFRSLRTHLGFTKTESPIRTIIVTSTGPSEGKTTVAANLAAVLAHSGKTVVLVDTDLRRPRVHRYIGLPNEAGLADLEDADRVSDLINYVQPIESTPGLNVLASGGTADNPSDLLSSDRMRELIHVLVEKYDHVVLDSPPMLVSDPHVLLGLADGVLLVMVPGITRLSAVRSIAEVIKTTGINILGVAFNRLKHGRSAGGGYGYYAYPYYYTSEYYYSENPETGKRERKKKAKFDERTTPAK